MMGYEIIILNIIHWWGGIKTKLSYLFMTSQDRIIEQRNHQ